ncbi:LADA_0D13300g1_1 [Lachancea dasiensis]|uniref:LADA_0D13300g1_1 n=1 Tax=Lachancea dasiensis TaxID=1072105 RepID=A0A1G4J968_9SACH|nr:LADA_0D13300g1_1 [Lachancea dasiensis]
MSENKCVARSSSLEGPQKLGWNKMSAFRLKNKIILITGASSGIGFAIAEQFAKQSDGEIKLILGARRVEKLDLLKEKLVQKYKNIDILIKFLDVSNSEHIDSFWESLPDRWADVDILVNNAGKALGQNFVGEISEEDINECFQTNVVGMISMTQHALKGMQMRNKGDIVQVGSIAGRETYPSGSIYCSTKFALNAFTSSLRKELTATKIRVIEVAPGNTKTEFAQVRFGGDLEKSSKVYEGTVPLDPTDVAEIAVFACSRPENVVLSEAVIMATNQAGPSHIHRCL